jgi:hypothetical protein
VPDEVYPLRIRPLDELPERVRRLGETAPPGAVPEVAHAETRLLEAAGANAIERGIPRDVVMADVDRYAREIVPAFNAYAYFRMGYWIARRTAGLRMLTLRKLASEKNGQYSPLPEDLPLLRYYANSIRHLFVGTGPASAAQ